MKTRGDKGYALILALLALALAGGGMVVLAAAMNTLDAETRRMTLDARRRDLEASALAWARRAHAAGALPAGEKPLDADALGIPSAGLKVAAAGPGRVGITTTVPLRRRPSVRTRARRLAGPQPPSASD